MAKIILDPGHGGRDNGDYYESRSEKNDNLLLILRVGRFLEAQGIEVVYTRKTDAYLANKERIALINESGADLMISLHHLSGGSYGYSLEFFIKENDLIARGTAVAIEKELYPVGYTTYKITANTDLPLLNEVSIPALMIGIRYLGADRENVFYDLNFLPIAEAIARGILEYLTLNTDNKSDLILKPMSACYCYRVMVGRYRFYDEAAWEQMILRNLDISAEMEYRRRRYDLYVGLTNQLDEAVLLEGKLRRLGYSTVISIV